MNLKYINSLRGIAIIMVMLVHYTQLFSVANLHLPLHLEMVFYSGKYGVLLFFIVSSYTLFRSLDIRKEDGFKNYYIRRFFRIAPLYYLIIIILFITTNGDAGYLQDPHDGITFYNLLTHVFFINGFFTSYTNSIVGVEWTIFVEVSFYMILPILFLYRKFLVHITISFFIISLLGLLGLEFINSHLGRIQLYFSPIIWLVAFAYGGLIYQYDNNDYIKRIFIAYKYLLLTIFILLFILFSYVRGSLMIELFALLMVMFFLLVKYNQFKVFDNRFLNRIGELSFSMYLIHFTVLLFIETNIRFIFFHNGVLDYISLFVVFVAITISISYLTYIFVEKPFIRIGKKFLSKYK
ncbi:acyltransferase [Francisellaceae bacterium CB300]